MKRAAIVIAMLGISMWGFTHRGSWAEQRQACGAECGGGTSGEASAASQDAGGVRGV